MNEAVAAIDQQLDERVRRAADDHSSRDDGSITATAHAPQIVNVETIGKHGVFVLWVSAFVAAAAVVTTLAFAFWIDRVSARVYVLEYDAGRMCARLEEKDIVEGCH